MLSIDEAPDVNGNGLPDDARNTDGDDGHSYSLTIDDVFFRAPISDFDATPDFLSVVERDNGAANIVWSIDGGALVTEALGGGEAAAKLNTSDTVLEAVSSLRCPKCIVGRSHRRSRVLLTSARLNNVETSSDIHC